MTRRPGHDIDGQPTKVDPRDFPDPLTVPDDFREEAEAELAAYRSAPRFGCLLAVLGCAAFWIAVYWWVT